MTDELASAIQAEEGIRAEASELAGEETRLTPALFMRLEPLLRRPIPPAFIETTPPVQGKPYESTGIRSVQVQIDRLNNVLTPLWWWDHAEYDQGGKLCTVTIFVGNPPPAPVYGEDGAPVLVRTFGEASTGAMVYRTSRGGVDRGSTLGNIYKGSYTNAAKLAIARLGPGHEVYLGTADFDPDVGGADASSEGVGREIAGNLWTAANKLGLKDKLQLAASHVVGRDVGDCKTKAKAQDALSTISFQDAERIDAWLQRKADEAAA